MDKSQMKEGTQVSMIIFIGMVVFFLNSLISQNVYTNYRAEGELFCAIDGYNYEKIDKSKVVEYDFLDIPFFTLNTWYFTNGFSSNCYVTKKYKIHSEKRIYKIFQ